MHSVLSVQSVLSVLANVCLSAPAVTAAIGVGDATEAASSAAVSQDSAGPIRAYQGPYAFTARSGPPESLHPDCELTSLLPGEGTYRVTGLDWLPGGDMAVLTVQDTVRPSEGGGRGWVHILSGAREAPAARPTLRTVYGGFANPYGLAVADGAIHVSQREGLVKLVDVDADGDFDSLATLTPYPDSSIDYWGKWAMNLMHRDGRFYTGLGTYHFTGEAGPCLPSPNRGTVHVADAQGRVEFLGTGLREPNGIGFGPDGELFATDNDGEWVAANRLVHVRKDGFYGLVPCGSWDPSLVPAPTAVWFPEHLRSPGQPLLLRAGTFAGQFVVGDYEVMGLSRIVLEKVGGQYQGALFPFTGGLASGGLRLLADEAGSLYVGELTLDGHEGWYVPGPVRPGPGGVEKLACKAPAAFEILTIRALPDGFELEFTGPAAVEAADPAAYRVKQWRLESTRNYGSPRYDQELLPVSEARLSADGRTATLRIPGLKAGRIVHVQLHDGFRAADNRAAWAHDVWYTLNAIPGAAGITPPSSDRPGLPRVSLRRAGAGARALSLDLPGEGALVLSDLGGRVVFRAPVPKGRDVILPAGLPAGIYHLQVRSGGRDFRLGLPLLP